MDNLNAVGVNLLWLTPGVVGGSEEYTIRLLRAADDVNRDKTPKNQLPMRLYAHPQLLVEYPDLSERFDVVTAPLIDTSFVQKGKRILAEHSWLAVQSRNDKVLHHAGGTVPFVRSAIPILTIHDLQPLEFPENFSRLKKAWLHTMIPRSVQAARTVICPSHFTADRVSELLSISPGKLKVVAHGHEASTRLDIGAASERVRARFGRFLLYPAIAYPHKRHRDLVELLDRLGSSFEDLSVVFTGSDGPELPKLRAQVLGLGLSSRVHFLGRIPAAELDDLYRGAAATLIPSSYEGFGNPALEAMARGCPLIVADAAALPEVVGEAALKVPVGDIEAWAAAVEKVLGSAGTAAGLRSAGLERAKKFDWESAGSALLEVYRGAQRQYLRS